MSPDSAGPADSLRAADPAARIAAPGHSCADLASLASLVPGEHQTRVVCAPFTGAQIAEIPLAGSADLDQAFAIARTAQAEWNATAVARRVEVLLRFRDLLLDRSESLLDIVQLETGKARRHAFEELADVAFVVAYYSRVAERLLGPRERKGAIPGLTRTSVVRHPRGVVGVIAPWNYPLVLTVSDSVPALFAGNAVIVKPDPQTTLTALAALDLMLAAGLPAGVFQVVPGDGPGTGGGVVDRADYISFTGSTATGRTVARRAGERLIGCSLELGGKNAMIVREDANLEAAVAGAIRGSFANAGQLCEGTERLYVQRSILDDFLAAFSSRVGQLTLGAGLDYEADMGSLTKAHQLRKTEEHVRDAVEKGAAVQAGGRARPDLGPLFYEPTVLTGVTSEMRIHSEETFGPVVSVYPFDTDEQAISLTNDSSYGLNASIWSGNARVARRMARRIHAGTVNINESYSAAWGSVDAPLGGMKDSGAGRRHGAEGILKYTVTQTVAVQRGLPLDLSTPWLRSRKARRAVLAILKRFRPGASRP